MGISLISLILHLTPRVLVGKLLECPYRAVHMCICKQACHQFISHYYPFPGTSVCLCPKHLFMPSLDLVFYSPEILMLILNE